VQHARRVHAIRGARCTIAAQDAKGTFFMTLPLRELGCQARRGLRGIHENPPGRYRVRPSRKEVVQFYFTLLFKEGRAVSPGRIPEPSPVADTTDSPGGGSSGNLMGERMDCESASDSHLFDRAVSNLTPKGFLAISRRLSEATPPVNESLHFRP